MLSHKYGLAHKPTVADFCCSFDDDQGLVKDSCSSLSLSIAAPWMGYFICYGAAWDEYEVLFQTSGSSRRNTRNA